MTPRRTSPRSVPEPVFEEAIPDLSELCRVHDVGLDLIDRSHDVDDLIDRVIDEYERRLADLPNDAFSGGGAPGSAAAGKVRALVMFACQASALREKAVAATKLRERAAALETANARLRETLALAETARARLDGVLAALSAGILIVDADGTVLQANRAAAALAGSSGVLGRRAPDFVLDIEPGTEREVTVGGPSTRRVLFVARRAVEGGATVALLSDVTSHVAEVEERHRLEKLAEILRTLSVLSHKINNPLTALLGRAQLLRAQADLAPRAARSAEVIEESSLRIAELIRELAGVVKEGRQEAVDRLLDMGAVAAPADESRR